MTTVSISTLVPIGSLAVVSVDGVCVQENGVKGGVGTVDALLNRLSRALNSNEQFEMDGSFQLTITQVHNAPRGSGKNGN